MTSEIQYNFLKDKICMKIFSLLNEKEDTARFVGGCVRDSIIGLKTNDIDIATKLKPEDVVKILDSESIKVVPTGIDHGTVSVFSKDFNFEITTLRSDISTDGRHAEVIFSDSWEEDSLRRDFTINSIYLKQNGEIYDPHNGIQHFTIGQRKGLGIAWPEPLYVKSLDREKNVVFVADKNDLLKKEAIISKVNWVSIEEPKQEIEVEAQIRYRSDPVKGTLIPLKNLDNQTKTFKLIFEESQSSVTPGQAAVFYKGEILLGGGLIS